jgi:inorganic triphosphatase YgiF
MRLASASARTQQLNSVYFDTPKFKLRKSGISLRVRSDGMRYIQTIKSDPGPGDVSRRDEWETEIAGAVPDLRATRGTVPERLLSKKIRRALKPVFETRVERKVFPLQTGGTTVELALDLGQLKASEKSEGICEVEIELKNGRTAELFRLAHLLAKAAPLRLSVRSNAERGYQLAEGKAAKAVTPMT